MRHRLGILITCVVIVHLAFFFFDFTEKKPPLPKKSLIVNTYIPPPPKPKPKPVPKPSHKVQSSPKPIKKSTPDKKREVLKELSETLAKIETKHQEIEKTAPIFLPKSIDFLQIDTNEEKVEEREYLLVLAASLKEALELLEVGKVKLELTVLNSGQVQKVRVLSTESEKNRRYLENQLLHLMFPSFTGELKKEKVHTFVLTFCNEK